VDRTLLDSAAISFHALATDQEYAIGVDDSWGRYCLKACRKARRHGWWFTVVEIRGLTPGVLVCCERVGSGGCPALGPAHTVVARAVDVFCRK